MPLADYVYRLVALNRSPGGVEFAKTLLGIDPVFDSAMILFEDVIQVLHRAMTTSVAERTFLLNSQDGCGVDRRQVRSETMFDRDVVG